ncbi:female-lethal(2)d [Citrus sinensis]|uniref:Female-lethal(2)d n=1 Tax=Citrus sinensis TaxID=2711 RepID=A0ACB8LRY9_CITSI|nr:female-lethal(2)d [Citrus sinensis]
MASRTHLDDDDDFGGDFSANHNSRRSGSKRSFGDIEDDEDDIFGSRKANSKVEETAPGVATGMILSLRESLQNCKDTLATCQLELEAAKLEIQKWHSSFQNELFIPPGTSPEPRLVINYLQTLKSSEEMLKEQLEKAKKKEAAFIVTFAKREQEIAELKSAVRDLKAQLKPPLMQARRLLLDPAIHEEFRRLKVGFFDAIFVIGVTCLKILSNAGPLASKPLVDALQTYVNMELSLILKSVLLHVDVNLVEEKDKKVKELEENIAAVSFTANSKMGKALMAKCKTLQEENDEIGRQNEEGETHQLSVKLALQKSLNAELKSQFEALYKHMDGLTDDVERSNEMVLMLREKLEEKDHELEKLKHELRQKSVLEEDKNDSVSDKNIGNDVTVSGEAVS